jgi:hypothetical protein
LRGSGDFHFGRCLYTGSITRGTGCRVLDILSGEEEDDEEDEDDRDR